MAYTEVHSSYYIPGSMGFDKCSPQSTTIIPPSQQEEGGHHDYSQEA